MANNRVYIACKRCVLDEDTIEDHLFYLAKYYPSSGWYPTNENLKDSLESWMDRHSHPENITLFGYDEDDDGPFFLYYEAGNRDQDRILKTISKIASEK